MNKKSVQASKLLDAYIKALRISAKDNIRISDNLATLYLLQMQESIKAMNTEITKNLSSGLSEYVRLTLHENLQVKLDMANIIRDAFKNIDFKNLESELSNNERHWDLQLFAEDYVTADKSFIKEIDITETITIPMGNNRIKMKTGDCIKLLIALVSALWILCTYSNNTDIEQSTTQSPEQESTLTEQELREILGEFLDSIDTSNSSDADSVEYWKGYAQGLLSNSLESSVSPDILHSGLSDSQDTAQSVESVVLLEENLPQEQSESHDNHPETIDSTN